MGWHLTQKKNCFLFLFLNYKWGSSQTSCLFSLCPQVPQTHLYQLSTWTVSVIFDLRTSTSKRDETCNTWRNAAATKPCLQRVDYKSFSLFLIHSHQHFLDQIHLLEVELDFISHWAALLCQCSLVLLSAVADELRNWGGAERLHHGLGKLVRHECFFQLHEPLIHPKHD